MTPQQTLSQRFPAGCYIGFNAAIDRRSAEQLVYVIGDAMRNGFNEINLCISSSGGILDHTHYACNLLDGMPIRLVTHNVGKVMSAANMLFLIGDERLASPGSTFYFHQTSFDPPAGGNITEAYLRDRLQAILNEDRKSADVIAAKTGLPVEEVQKWQTGEMTMTTDIALANGIIHEVRSLSIPPNAFFHQVVI